MRTFEGTVHIKFHRNLFGKKNPITIDCENEEELRIEKARISSCWKNDGAISVVFDLSERK